jgi:phosphoribosylformylglycinamidine synthase
MWEFAEAVRGLGVACRALDVPIVSGNVSLYNATVGASIKPTPSVAVVGSFDGPFDPAKVVRHRVTQPGLELWLVGPQAGTLDGSEFAAMAGFGDQGMLAPVDLDLEARLQKFLIAGAAARLFAAAHDLSEGGLAVAVAEMFLGQTDVGAKLTANLDGDLATALFHEGPSRVVLAVTPENRASFVAAAEAASLPLLALGASVAGDRLDWAGLFFVSLAEATARFDTGLDPIRRGRG